MRNVFIWILGFYAIKIRILEVKMTRKLDRIGKSPYNRGDAFSVVADYSSDRLLDALLESFGLPELYNGWPFDGSSKRMALVDLKETDNDLIAYIELPGVDKEDVHLDITEDTLEARVERKSETKDEKDGYLKEERTYSEFYRSIKLPYRVKSEEAKATYKDGVLEVVMPKAEQRVTKKIEIE